MSDNYGLAGGGRDRYRSGRGRPIEAVLNPHIDEDTAAAFALGALDAAERDLVECHGRLCSACAALISRDLATAGVLAYAARPIVPSLATKAALFARIAHTQRAAAETNLPTIAPSLLPPTLTLPASRPIAADAVSVDNDRPPVYLLPRSSARVGRLAQYLSAPLMIGLLAIGAWGFSLQTRVSSLNAAVAERNAEVTELTAALGGFANGPVQVYDLASTDATFSVEGSLTVGTDPRVVVLALNLTKPSASRDYEMWVVDQNGQVVPKPVAEINVGERGSVAAVVELDQPLSNYQSVYVKAKPIATDAVDDGAASALQSNIADPAGIGSTSGDANGTQDSALP